MQSSIADAPRTHVHELGGIVEFACGLVSRTPFVVLNTVSGNGTSTLHLAVNNGGNVALIKAALHCAVGPPAHA